MRAFWSGILATLAALALGAVAAVYFGAFPVGADIKPPTIEKKLAQLSLHIATDRNRPTVPAIYEKPSSAILTGGAKLYNVNCAVCHGSGGTPSEPFAKGLYIKAPQLAKHGVTEDPISETYWKIDHGIRFTAMPAFTTILTDDQMWHIAAFLKESPKSLPPQAQAIWDKRAK